MFIGAIYLQCEDKLCHSKNRQKAEKKHKYFFVEKNMSWQSIT